MNGDKMAAILRRKTSSGSGIDVMLWTSKKFSSQRTGDAKVKIEVEHAMIQGHIANKVYPHLLGGVENRFAKTIPQYTRDSNLKLPVIGSLGYNESSALDHAATEAFI
uniref:Uncharacterized protein n=1 Tax=Timema douglasi TaxID=61478 RepID=A0A7R8VFT8_TIMDO|nr:unnamed protein product [Timema douglasi]